ncbi:MAG TPA: DUF169 domain-containing protein [Syntrophorhabdaceae bacterium]|nr:DUF169 domain-containing protein [Syntrophorhabdaceae bacterium]
METAIKERFIGLWRKYFEGAELPIVFFYTDNEDAAPRVRPPKDHRCIVADIARVRKGKSLLFDNESVGCFGGKKYLGFFDGLRPNFDYFLSYGIPGEVEGERYKKTPELVNEVMKAMPQFRAPHRYIAFKRWDNIEETDDPEVVIIFGTPDVISGVFTLSNYDENEQNGVLSPFGAGCATIVLYPYLERKSARPRSILGMFDVSARPCVPADVITFATPMSKFLRMIDNMDESFLITESWKKVGKRIARKA